MVVGLNQKQVEAKTNYRMETQIVHWKWFTDGQNVEIQAKYCQNWLKYK